MSAHALITYTNNTRKDWLQFTLKKHKVQNIFTFLYGGHLPIFKMWDATHGSHVPFATWSWQPIYAQLCFTMLTREITVWRSRTVASLDGSVLEAFIGVTVKIWAVTFTPISWDLLWLVVGVPRVTGIFLATNVISKL